jgi:hypothetical protein
MVQTEEMSIVVLGFKSARWEISHDGEEGEILRIEVAVQLRSPDLDLESCPDLRPKAFRRE